MIYLPEQQSYRTFSLLFPAAAEEADIILSKMAPFFIPSGFSQTSQKTYFEIHYTISSLTLYIYIQYHLGNENIS